VTTCTIGGATYESISNVGTRPTVEQDSKVNCETYLLNFSGDLYGSTITTSFLKFLRSEEKFDSETALTQQIQSDIAQAQEYFQKNNS
jgi:riboflavin kinase/FMN adenylyltransferase